MKQEGKDPIEEFRLLETWGRFLAANESTLLRESNNPFLGLQDIRIDKSCTLREGLDARWEKAMEMFRKRARALYGQLLRQMVIGVSGRDPGPPKKGEWDDGRNVAMEVIAHGTPLNIIVRLREMLALRELATTEPLDNLPGDPPWEAREG
jgi:hypothetical protein